MRRSFSQGKKMSYLNCWRERRAAVDNDGADTLILGSTTMHQSHSYLVSKLEVPILNPGLIALKVCENLVELGIAHSKSAYPDPEVISDDAF